MTSADGLLVCLLSFIGGIFLASFLSFSLFVIFEFLALGLFYFLLSGPWRKASWLALGQSGKARQLILVFGLCLIVFAIALFRFQSVEVGLVSNNIQSSSTSDVEHYNLLEKLRGRFSQVIGQNISQPQAGLLSAILLGQKQEISPSFKTKLSRAGLSHITAISGMHIVIISQILFFLGLLFGLYRGQAFYFAVIFLWLFILMIGSSPSAVRAGVMGSIFLLAEKLGRQKTADRALFLTAALMLAINPTLLRDSISFQFSFLASLGIIYLLWPIQRILLRFANFVRKIYKTLTSDIRVLENDKTLAFQHFNATASDVRVGSVCSLLAMTLSAQVFTLPLIIYHFGQFSIVSPLSNILAVPVLPYLMGLGLSFVILGAFFAPLAFLLLFPVWLLLSWLVWLTNFFSNLSFASLNWQLTWPWLLPIYGLLAIFVWRIKIRQRSLALP